MMNKITMKAMMEKQLVKIAKKHFYIEAFKLTLERWTNVEPIMDQDLKIRRE